MSLYVAGSSERVRVDWIQEIILTEPGRGKYGEMEKIINGGVSCEDDCGEVYLLHRGFVWNTKDLTEDWKKKDDWVGGLVGKINKDACRQIRLEKDFIEKADVKQSTEGDLYTWPQFQKAVKIREHYNKTGIPFTKFILKNFKKGNSIFRMSFRTEFGVEAAPYDERSFKIIGAKASERGLKNDISHVSNKEIRRELWKNFYEVQKNDTNSKYQIVIIGHPNYQHNLVSGEKDMISAEELEWPRYSFGSKKSIAFVFSPKDRNFVYRCNAHMTENGLKEDKTAQIFAAMGLLCPGGKTNPMIKDLKKY
ncbi:hypothetical protein HYT92_02535 [Candidatus Pacearchaeota archaeon]|nr:hypothetical protein [Candidatus Pacearchaeota archaeon]